MKMIKNRIDDALDRLQDMARDADHAAKSDVIISLDDLVIALEELDRVGIIHLDLD